MQSYGWMLNVNPQQHIFVPTILMAMQSLLQSIQTQVMLNKSHCKLVVQFRVGFCDTNPLHWAKWVKEKKTLKGGFSWLAFNGMTKETQPE